MNQNIKYEMRDKYLYVKIASEFNAENIKSSFNSFIEDAIKNNVEFVLFDARESKINVNLLERYEIGKYIAKKGIQLKKIACLLNEEHLDKKFMENVIYNRGLNILATTDEKEALEWLMK